MKIGCVILHRCTIILDDKVDVQLDHKWSKQLIMNAGTTGTGHTARRGCPPSPHCRLKPQLKPTAPDDQAPTWRLLPPPETSRTPSTGLGHLTANGPATPGHGSMALR